MRRERHRLLMLRVNRRGRRSRTSRALTSATRWAELTARQRCCADSMSLNTIAIPAAREPGPLVTRCRSRTVARSTRSGWWCAGGSSAYRGSRRKRAARRGVGDLRDRFGQLRAVGRGERLRGLLGVVAVFGVVDLRHRGLGVLVRRLRERGEDVADLVPPAPLLFRVGEHVAHALQNPSAPSPRASTEARIPRACDCGAGRPTTSSSRGARHRGRSTPWPRRRGRRSSPAGTPCPARAGP
jgi:hypothetical protein